MAISPLFIKEISYKNLQSPNSSLSSLVRMHLGVVSGLRSAALSAKCCDAHTCDADSWQHHCTCATCPHWWWQDLLPSQPTICAISITSTAVKSILQNLNTQYPDSRGYW